jgi:pimeloyl-ACP methyl ester carboxylesterase
MKYCSEIWGGVVHKMSYPNTRSRKLLLAFGFVLLCMAPVVKAQQSQASPANPVKAPEEKFNLGVVIDRVVSASDPTKSYALYLPTAYTIARKFPVLYCFDPSARGTAPVTRFKDAAEKYGYIVVGSNNSRNGPQQLSEIVRDLWADSHARLSIDDQRVYLAGFSGGARVAISVAFWLKDRVAGVIACGAGFPSEVPIGSPRSFVLFAVAGTEDFNNPEIQTVARKLEGSTPPVRLAVFEGGHAWLPPELATDALGWLEVQAMKSGIRERNPALIDEIFEQALSQASVAQAQGDRYRAYQRFAATAQDFSGLHDVVEVEKKAKDLSATKEIKDGLKQEKKMEEEQNFRIQRIHTLIGAFEVADNNSESLVALRDELRGQREAAKGTEPSVKRALARRVMGSLFIEFFELGNAAISRKEYQKAATYYFLCTEIQPDNARGFYHLARSHALAGSRSKALEALRTAADKGFAGVQELGGSEFEDLQGEKRFKETLDLVKKNQSSQP